MPKYNTFQTSPDKEIKDSFHRIKSSSRNQNFVKLELTPIRKQTQDNLSFMTDGEQVLEEFKVDSQGALKESNPPEDEFNYYNSDLDKNIIHSPSEAGDDEVHERSLFQLPKTHNESFKESQTENRNTYYSKFMKSLFGSWLLRFLERFERSRPIIFNIILLYNMILQPLSLAIEKFNYGGILSTVEVLITLAFLLNFAHNLRTYSGQKQKAIDAFKKGKSFKNNLETRREKFLKTRFLGEITLYTLILDFLFIFPFGLIFSKFQLPQRRTDFFLILIQLVRICNFRYVPWLFYHDFFKTRYALGNILGILFSYFILNHVFACLFIVLANTRTDFNETWLAKIPAPQFNYPNNVRTILDVDIFTIYIHASYWSYVTTSHVGKKVNKIFLTIIGVGDVVGINSDEKLYSSFVIMTSTFLYAFLFGNLASIVGDLTPRFRKEFIDNYRTVLEYAKLAKLDMFREKIHVERVSITLLIIYYRNITALF